ncbi:hypothetical protein [Burkholderia sp. AU16741]|uniref:hypothetical protein n=1 Tax=Burkholderia sp. AU16741 TaxID=2015347 RepID=UPI00211AAC0D|nr:hypothetical protein [Burkholderia sp. AU16741]
MSATAVPAPNATAHANRQAVHREGKRTTSKFSARSLPDVGAARRAEVVPRDACMTAARATRTRAVVRASVGDVPASVKPRDQGGDIVPIDGAFDIG